jgi:hypothetical protein
MHKNIVHGVIISVVAGIFLFVALTFPSRYQDRVHTIDKEVEKLKGKVEILAKETQKNTIPVHTVTEVQTEKPPSDPYKNAQTGATDYWFTNISTRDTVPRHFRVEGKMKKQPIEHLWLAVEVGGLIWLKEPEIKIVGTRWVGQVYEGGSPPKGKFILALYEVNERGHRKIMEWLNSGHKVGHYPGLPAITGGRKVAAVDLRLGT